MFPVNEDQLEKVTQTIQDAMKQLQTLQDITDDIKKQSKVSNPLDNADKQAMDQNLQTILLLQSTNAVTVRQKLIQYLLNNALTANLTLHDMSTDILSPCNKTKILSEKQQYWQTIAIMITSVVSKQHSQFCLSMAQCIVSYMANTISIVYPSDISTSDYLKFDVQTDAIVIDAVSGLEQRVLLSEPSLFDLQADKAAFSPFKLSFNLEFLRKDNDGYYHGGVHWGSTALNHDRWSGHKQLESGAVTTVVDCYHDTARWRVYGAAGRSPGQMIHDPKRRRGLKQLNGKRWDIVFESYDQCVFYHDAVEICRFRAVNCCGYIGFWVWKGGSIKVSNVTVEAVVL